MKYHRPRTVAFINSVIITLAYLILAVISSVLFHPYLGYWLLILYIVCGTTLIFIFSFLVFRFTLEKFIYSKIRLIYKTIYNIKAPKNTIKHKNSHDDVLEHVSHEVESWEREKSSEIEHLQQMERYRKDFLGNVSHELKTPVFTIQGYISTLLDGGLEDPVVNREYLKRAEINVERLINIIEDLDEIAQLESGEVKINPVRFDIAALAEEVVNSLEIKTTKNNVSVHLNKEEKPVFVIADKEKIRQVYTNLMDNAIRYRSPEDARIKISFFDMDENILTEITDNGIGIEQEEIPRVFERFYRTEKGRASSKKGKGLGLAIVKHIINAHNQTVHLRSAVGIGTTVGFTLKKAN
jgi:two-component system phosphate regulon sensor histidine kinase PhoR